VINAYTINQTTGALTALAGSPYPIFRLRVQDAGAMSSSTISRSTTTVVS
jgi:hypothetical protein